MRSSESLRKDNYQDDKVTKPITGLAGKNEAERKCLRSVKFVAGGYIFGIQLLLVVFSSMNEIHPEVPDGHKELRSFKFKPVLTWLLVHIFKNLRKTTKMRKYWECG